MRECNDAARCLPHLDLALLFQTMLEALGLGKVGLRTQLAVVLVLLLDLCRPQEGNVGTHIRANINWLELQAAHTG